MPDSETATWYRDAIVYELHVRSFRDGNGDGVGDFAGLVEKLDYLRNLGVSAVWLLPFYPSPLRDDGYDISDYTDVHPVYGTVADVRRFVREAHRRGLRVITELVCNHTSDQHPWFQRARRAKPGSPWRDFYVWSDTSDRYREAPVIFKDFEASNWTWDPVAGAYYWHRFYSHQPDLNFDNPRVRRAILGVVDFWLEMGIDGLRLDAVPYLFEREGTTCDNLPETHRFLKDLRRHVDARFPDRMLLAEANQWPEDAVAYFGEGDECHMCFHFPLMPRLFTALSMEDRFPIIDILAQTPPIPDGAQWGLFLRNHDELSLEMVSDEERDHMHRGYLREREALVNLGIRRRLTPLLGGHRQRIELMNALLFALPGTPFIYYGDEIGMGDNIFLGDRHSVRTPMQWSSDRNAGFSTANPQRVHLPVIVDPEYHYEAVNVGAQERNPDSLLSWMKRLIALRRSSRALGRGTFEALHPENRRVLAFVRGLGSERILVVANLSGSAQHVELDLRALEGRVPVELFGRTRFPRVRRSPYSLTLGPYGFLWFALEPQRVEAGEAPQAAPAGGLPEVGIAVRWDQPLPADRLESLVAPLRPFLSGRPWFGRPGEPAPAIQVVDAVPVAHAAGLAHLLLVEARPAEGERELYALPVAHATGERARDVAERSPDSVIARTAGADGQAGVLHDALAEPSFAQGLVEAVFRRRRLRGARGSVLGTPLAALRGLAGPGDARLEPTRVPSDLGDSSVLLGERLVLKLFRRLEEGSSPELELGQLLTERASFTQLPPLAGHLQYAAPGREPAALAALQVYVPNQGTAWQHAVAAAGDFLDSALAGGVHPVDYADRAGLLGRRTAELHAALASDGRDERFAPEPTGQQQGRSLYQSTRALAHRVLALIRSRLRSLPPDARREAEAVLQAEAALEEGLRAAVDCPLPAWRIRCHGNLHLGNVLFTGHDFVVVDFVGDRSRSLSERRLKRWALHDVASMLRSFDYAAQHVLLARAAGPDGVPAERLLVTAAGAWSERVTAAYLDGYRAQAAAGPLAGRAGPEATALLHALLLERALREVRHELTWRPAWARVPLRGILGLLSGGTAHSPALQSARP